MELSSCPQCSAKRNIPLSFSFFLTNRFHLALSCSHCGARYVPTMLQRIVQLVLVLVLGTMFGLLYVPALKLASTLSKIGLFGLQPFRLFALLLLFALAHWLPLRVLPWKKLESTAAFHRGRSVSFFIISIAISFLVTMLISFQFAPEALMRALY